MLDKVPAFLKNKYAIAVLAFLVWMLFFDRNNFINQIRLVSSKNDMIRQKQFYSNEIKKDSAVYHLLNTDTSSLEKYAREKYLMKKDNEDIYVIIDK